MFSLDPMIWWYIMHRFCTLPCMVVEFSAWLSWHGSRPFGKGWFPYIWYITIEQVYGHQIADSYGWTSLALCQLPKNLGRTQNACYCFPRWFPLACAPHNGLYDPLIFRGAFEMSAKITSCSLDFEANVVAKWNVGVRFLGIVRFVLMVSTLSV